MSNSVRYQHIQDDYWYGMVADCRLLIDRSTGYFNATRLCQDFGKQFYHWNKNKHSQQLITLLRTNGYADNIVRSVSKDNVSADRKIVKGTYVPELLLLNIALWLSPKCYIDCSEIIRDFTCNGIQADDPHEEDRGRVIDTVTEIKT